MRPARDIVYWPGITAQLKDHLSRCGICNRYQPEQCKEPLKPHDVLNLPWEKVGADLFLLDGQSFLIAVDYYSGYFEVQDMSGTTSTRVMAWFSRHGIPVIIISDNGPPFNNEDFKRPSVRNGIFTTPHQALITHKVMVVLKMRLRLASHY